MKKIYIVLAVLATALFSSCEREPSFNDYTVGENDVAFVFSDVDTKAAVNLPAPVRGISVPVGVDAQGEALFLEETIEELNPSPATKGAPAYTVNLGKVYKEIGIYANEGNFGGDASYYVMDEYINKDESLGKGWRYTHSFSSRPWPTSDDAKVNFYLRMPAFDAEFDYSTVGSIAFDYTSTASGSDQQDILFGYTSLSKSEHDGFLPNGAPVEMVHALTGVKFRSAAENGSQTKTIITKVEITGLKGSGHCVVTPSATTPVVWTSLGSGPGTYTLEYTNPDYSTEAWKDGTVNYVKGDKPQFGDSWYSAAADHNLNNDAGELTFWFIPQEMTDDVKLKVTFCVKTPDTSGEAGGGYETHEIDLGKIINKDRETPVKWEAGQLRTYTLNPKLVDVEIFDTMSGLSKTNLHVTNTGNVSEIVRMMVIGNWYGWASQDDADAGKEPMILVGYKTNGAGGASDNEMIDPWFREDAVYGQYFDDSFKGGHPAAGSKWVRGTGSYFYYMDAIGPNSKLSGTESLFQSYVLPSDKIPTIYIPNSSSNIRSQAVGVHLVMEVVIQAIAAPTKEDGSAYSEDETIPASVIWKAWSDAIGKEIKEKPYTD